MPELGEVAHAASLLRKYILGKTIKTVVAAPDDLLFVKPLTSELFISGLTGQKVTAVGRNGKYFWIELGGKKTLILHFGMTGWIHIRNVQSHFIAMESGGDKKQREKMEAMIAEGKDPKEAKWESTEWPPRFTKFSFTTDAEDELAFSDARRLGRARLIDLPEGKIGSVEPLSKLGRDFSQETPPADDVVPEIIKRKVPVKSLLLDQSVFSGVGNWMADEILYQSRLHPEQYSDTLGTTRATNLYENVLNVCKIAAETEGNTAAFPSNWLMLHRWGKSRSKKEVQKTPDGHVVGFVSVGGRTSCFVPDLQRKFKAVKDEEEDDADAGRNIKEEESNEAKTTVPASKRRKPNKN